METKEILEKFKNGEISLEEAESSPSKKWVMPSSTCTVRHVQASRR